MTFEIAFVFESNILSWIKFKVTFIDYSKIAKNVRVLYVYTRIKIITTVAVEAITIPEENSLNIFYRNVFDFKTLYLVRNQKRIDFLNLNERNKCYLNNNSTELLGIFSRTTTTTTITRTYADSCQNARVIQGRSNVNQ